MASIFSPFRLHNPKTIITDVNRNLDSIASTFNPLTNTATTNKWIYVGIPGSPQFQNSWKNFGTPYAPLRFLKDANNFVHLSGLITGGTVSSTITGVIFILPAGYRPLYPLLFATNANGAFSEIRIGSFDTIPGTNAGGTVSIFSGANGYVTLDGITFLAEQ